MKAMTERTAFVTVADDIYTSYNGKLNIIGAYTQDIAIVSDPFKANQLLFVFRVETAIDDPIQTLSVEITFPGRKSLVTAMTLPQTPPSLPGRTRQALTFTIPAVYVDLRPGKIDVKVIHERGSIDVLAPWISMAQPQTGLASG
jgi:hypothetical protein